MKRNRLSEKDKQGYQILAGISVFVLLMIIVAYFILQQRTCDENNPSAHVLIMIDTTDPLTAGQQKRVSQLVNDVKNEIETCQKFSIFALDAKLEGLSAPLFSACQPPKGSDANPFYQNRRLFEKKFRQSFQDLFENVLPRITRGGDGARSPIIEALVEIGERVDFSQKIKKRRLVLISDLLQNTDIFSFLTRTTGGLVPLANLTGVEVEMHVIQRNQNKNLQGDVLTQFWIKYFQDSGATISQITKRF